MLDILIFRDQGAEATSENNTSDFDLLGLKKNMTRAQRDESSLKAALRLKQAGCTFPDDDLSVESGMESDVRSNDLYIRRKKVKSGAEIKKRPVLKTELWPHTISNEEDGEDVTSDNISLANFLSCFAYIMTKSKGAEAKGRTMLLLAITKVLNCLPWTEARLFHNLVMHKLEQGRISWDIDFTILANDFIEKKVRLLLKNKAQTKSSGSSARPGYSKGYGSSRYGNSYQRSKNSSAHALICYQWNEGNCTYGDRCKRWHVCRTCADAGKPGEKHQAVSHKDSGNKGEQR